MKGNFHVRFLGEGVAAMPLPYPTLVEIAVGLAMMRGIAQLNTFAFPADRTSGETKVDEIVPQQEGHDI